MRRVFSYIMCAYMILSLGLLISCGKKYTITYDFDGGTVEGKYTLTFTYPQKVNAPKPTKEGYVFVGWEDEEGLIEVFETRDYSLKALWIVPFSYELISEQEVFTQPEKEYMVYFYQTSCSWCTQIKNDVLAYLYKQDLNGYQETTRLYVVNLTAGGKTASIFRSYTGKGGQGSSGKMFIDGTTEYSQLYISSTPCLIKIYDDAGTPKAKMLASGATGVVKEMNKGLVKDPTVASGNKTIYTITYEFNGGQTQSTYTTTFTNPKAVQIPTPTKEGYIFIGWMENSQFIDIFESRDYTLTAIWIEPFEYDVISEVDIFNMPESEYMIYIYRDGCSWCEKIKNDVLKYLYQTSLPHYAPSMKLYVLNLTEDGSKSTIFRSYTGEGGQGTNGTIYVDGTTEYDQMYIPSTPTLIKINKVNEVATASLLANGAITVVTEINKGLKKGTTGGELNVKYTITYELDGGIFDGDVVTTYYSFSKVTLPKPTKEGYIFAGWYEENQKISIAKDKNYNLVAKWIESVDLTEIAARDIFDLEGDHYYIFFIKNSTNMTDEMWEIITLFHSLNSSMTPVYIVNLSKVENFDIAYTYTGSDGQGEGGIFFVDGVNVWDDLMIPRTPTLIEIKKEDEYKESYYVASQTALFEYLQNLMR